MNCRFTKQPEKTLAKMDKKLYTRILAAIAELPNGDVKQLEGKFLEFYRLRVGDWRVIYSIKPENIIVVEKILPRGNAYK